jgi:hypothetical protein
MRKYVDMGATSRVLNNPSVRKRENVSACVPRKEIKEGEVDWALGPKQLGILDCLDLIAS